MKVLKSETLIRLFTPKVLNLNYVKKFKSAIAKRRKSCRGSWAPPSSPFHYATNY